MDPTITVATEPTVRDVLISIAFWLRMNVIVLAGGFVLVGLSALTRREKT